jgi:hypothetical protein
MFLLPASGICFNAAAVHTQQVHNREPFLLGEKVAKRDC